MGFFIKNIESKYKQFLLQVLLILSFEHLTKGDILQHFLQYPFAKMGKDNIPPNYWMFVPQWWIDLKHETPRF
jgi:hypothetical protein